MKGEIIIAAKHIVKCALCNESFDANEESYVKVNSRRYAHATCAKQNDLQLPIINPLNFKICIYCNKEIDITKENYKELTKGKFAHLSCWEENKDKLTDKEKLEIYINNLFGSQKLNPKINKQIKDYVENFGYTYSGIHKALIYYYEIKGNKFDLSKTGGGIGIVPFCYQQAYNYYYSIWEAQQNQKTAINQTGIEKFIPKVIEIKIPVPTCEPKKQKLFSFLDKEELHGI